MKVLHTIFGLYPSLGGLSSSTYNLLKALRDYHAFDVDILTFFPKDKHDVLIGSDDFIKTVKNDTFSPLLISGNFKDFLQKSAEYDIYHVNGIWTYPSHITSKYARKVKKPYIISPHGMLSPLALRVSSWKKKIIYPLFQAKDIELAGCIHVTSEMEMKYIRHMRIKNPIAIIPNGLDISYDIPQIREGHNEKRKIGFVGRIDRIKNIDKLIMAWAALKGDTLDAHLIIIGDGNTRYLKELMHLLKKYSLRNVVFKGFLGGPKLQQAIRDLDYLVLPSKSENFGMVVPEALINGVPVIASKGTPWRDLNTYNCGWWIDDDTQIIKQYLKLALDIPESKRKEMGRNGQKLVVEKYNIRARSDQMIQLYKWVDGSSIKPDFIYE